MVEKRKYKDTGAIPEPSNKKNASKKSNEAKVAAGKTAAARPKDKTTKQQLPPGEDKPAKTKATSDIDDLFGKLKQKKTAPAPAAPKEEEAKKQSRPKVKGSKDDIFGTDDKKGRKLTDEGYVVYSEEELGLLKKGGETDLCPFDCECCF